MTTLLEHAFAKAATLTAAEQDVLASRLLAGLAGEKIVNVLEVNLALRNRYGTPQ